MSKSRSVRLVPVAAAALVLAGAAATGSGARVAPPAQPRIAPTHASAASARHDWFWSKHTVKRTLLLNGISWPRVRQHWTVAQALCNGLGHWIVRRRVPRFRNYYCHVRAFPRGSRYPSITTSSSTSKAASRTA